MDAAFVARARGFAEEQFTDTCRIYIPGSVGPIDETTGQQTPGADADLYTGPCKVQVAQPQPEVPTAGAYRFTLGALVVSVPISTVGVKPKHRVQVTACEFDPDLVGRKFVVTAVLRKSHATARRLQVEEVTA